MAIPGDDEEQVRNGPALGEAGAEPLCIPHAELSAGALRGLVEAFVLREGTEYGAHDVPLESKVAQVMRQLECGEARVIFDPGTEVVDIVTARSLRRPAVR